MAVKVKLQISQIIQFCQSMLIYASELWNSQQNYQMPQNWGPKNIRLQKLNSHKFLLLIPKMLPIRIPSKKKQNRSGSMKVLNEESTNHYGSVKKTNFNSSRKQTSNRSEIENKNMSYLNLDGLGSCCSGHGLRHKKISLLEKEYAHSFQPPSKSHTSSIKNPQKKPKSSHKSSNKLLQIQKSPVPKLKSKSKILQLIDDTNTITTTSNTIINKMKKQSVNNAGNVNMGNVNKKKLRNNNKSTIIYSKNSLLESGKSKKRSGKNNQENYKIGKNRQEKSINQEIDSTIQCGVQNVSSFSSARHCNGGSVMRNLASRGVCFEENQFLIREPTQKPDSPRQDQQRHLSTVEQKPQLQSTQLQPPKISLSKKGSSSHTHSQLVLTKKLQKYHEQQICELKQTNLKLKEQLTESYKKYENMLLQQNEEIRKIENKNLVQQQKIKNQVFQWRVRANGLEKQCERVRQEKIQIQGQFQKQLERERNIRVKEQQELKRKLSAIQECYAQLRLLSTKLETKNSQLSEQIQKLNNQKQKYERALQKCQQQLNTIQSRLQNEISRTKKQQKQLQILRKQKKYIKENSELILEIVRNEIKDTQKKQSETWNQENYVEENLKKILNKFSPKKRNPLEEAN